MQPRSTLTHAPRPVRETAPGRAPETPPGPALETPPGRAAAPTPEAAGTAAQARDAAPGTGLASLASARTVVLTSFRRDGRPVGTPVTIAVERDRAFVRTYDRAWKYRRMRRDPRVTVASSTLRGRPLGPAVAARARLLDGAEAAHAAELIARKHPVLQGIVVPAVHRLRGYRTVHFELTEPGSAASPGTDERRAEQERRGRGDRAPA